MRAPTIAASLVLGVLPAVLTGQAVQPPAWLAGCWEQRTGSRESLEMWMPPAGGLMLGASRTLVNGAVREYEQLRIAVDSGKLVYTATPSGQQTASFTSTRVTDTRASRCRQPAARFPAADHLSSPRRGLADRAGRRRRARIRLSDEAEQLHALGRGVFG